MAAEIGSNQDSNSQGFKSIGRRLNHWNKIINPHHQHPVTKEVSRRNKVLKERELDEQDSNEDSEELRPCSYCEMSLRKGNLSNHIRTVHDCEVDEKFIYDVSFAAAKLNSNEEFHQRC